MQLLVEGPGLLSSRPVITLPNRNECFCDAKTKPLYCQEIAMVSQENMGGDFSIEKMKTILTAKYFRPRHSETESHL